MKFTILILMLFLFSSGMGQETVTEKVDVSSQDHLHLKFDFADDIVIEFWDRNEVMVEATVNINDNADNDIFQLTKSVSDDEIRITLNTDKWKGVGKNENCSWRSELYYKVYLPRGMTLSAETISGNFITPLLVGTSKLKTISGDIDLSVPPSKGMDFHAKTISGEIYSDLDITYPDGKDGLRQIVGMDIYGRINEGGTALRLETISGNIYLRKG